MSYLVKGLNVIEDEIMEGIVHFNSHSFYWWPRLWGVQAYVPDNYRIIELP